MKCRHCSGELTISLANLGNAPPSNAYLTEQDLRAIEKWYPLKILVCAQCWLAQTEDYTGRGELFSANYAYFSSFSTSWLAHCQEYVQQVIRRFALNHLSRVGEVAANDGYLLQYFQQARIPCFGIEPTASTANAARQKGLPIIEEFFGCRLALELRSNHCADLLIANNVLAHVPDINDFVAAFCILLKPNGVATFEFPHLYRLIQEGQFDTFYHEHFSYLSFATVKQIFARNKLAIFDVEELATHGGSLRIFAQRQDTGRQPCSAKVQTLLVEEKQAGMAGTSFYEGFQTRITTIKREFLKFLLAAQANNKKVVGYGAAAKGNTLLNFSGVRSDLVNYVVDRNPAKQGKYLPGSHIPIVAEEILQIDKPDWIVIFPWNLREEVINQLAYAREWGAKFVTAIPSLAIH